MLPTKMCERWKKKRNRPTLHIIVYEYILLKLPLVILLYISIKKITRIKRNAVSDFILATPTYPSTHHEKTLNVHVVKGCKLIISCNVLKSRFQRVESWKTITAASNNAQFTCRAQISRHLRTYRGTLQNMFDNNVLWNPCGGWFTFTIPGCRDQTVSTFLTVLTARPDCTNCVSTGADYFLDRVSWTMPADAFLYVIALTINLLLDSAGRYS